MCDVLKKEIATFEKYRHDLVACSKGKFVLIKDEAIIGVYDSQMDAIEAGYNELGLVPFLTKLISWDEEILHV